MHTRLFLLLQSFLSGAHNFAHLVSSPEWIPTYTAQKWNLKKRLKQGHRPISKYIHWWFSFIQRTPSTHKYRFQIGISNATFFTKMLTFLRMHSVICNEMPSISRHFFARFRSDTERHTDSTDSDWNRTIHLKTKCTTNKSKNQYFTEKKNKIKINRVAVWNTVIYQMNNTKNQYMYCIQNSYITLSIGGK